MPRKIWQSVRSSVQNFLVFCRREVFPAEAAGSQMSQWSPICVTQDPDGPKLSGKDLFDAPASRKRGPCKMLLRTLASVDALFELAPILNFLKLLLLAHPQILGVGIFRQVASSKKGKLGDNSPKKMTQNIVPEEPFLKAEAPTPKLF